MNWEEFKKRVEELGVKNEDEIKWIDIHGTTGTEDVDAAKDRDGKVAIYTK